jgi:hypothetical protein
MKNDNHLVGVCPRERFELFFELTPGRNRFVMHAHQLSNPRELLTIVVNCEQLRFQGGARRAATMIVMFQALNIGKGGVPASTLQRSQRRNIVACNVLAGAPGYKVVCMNIIHCFVNWEESHVGVGFLTVFVEEVRPKGYARGKLYSRVAER